MGHHLETRTNILSTFIISGLLLASTADAQPKPISADQSSHDPKNSTTSILTNVLLQENFSTAADSTPPAGWVRNRMIGQTYDEWRYDNPGRRNAPPPFVAPFAIFDSDLLSEFGGAEDVALESPAFSAGANATVILTMDHFFRGGSNGRATIEIFTGAAWVSVWDSVQSTPNPQSLVLNISAQTAGVTNARIRFRWRGWWSWWWMIDNIVITETSTGNSGVIADQFNSTSLDTTVWRFENPKGDASYAMTGTQLSISVPAGSAHDVWEGGNFAPRVVQFVNNPLNFELRVKFDATMNQRFQTEGIQIWQDTSNLLRLEFHFDGGNLQRLAWSFVDGIHQDVGTAGLVSVPTAPLYMRIKRQGDVWSQSWSTSGLTYTVGTSFSRSMNVTKIGLYAGNAGIPESSAPAYTGLFDYVSTGNLPVELSRFSATVASENAVQINWTTLTETNNAGFEIQKSQSNVTGFETIANSFIPGHGTTNIPHDYVWTDSQPSIGIRYYRIKQMELNGSVLYSDPVQVSIVTGVGNDVPKVFSLSQNYPNPFNPSTDIKFSVANTAHATLAVFNTLGQKVMTLFDGVAEAGQYHVVRLNASALSSGTYFYKLESGAKTSIKKLLLLK